MARVSRVLCVVVIAALAFGCESKPPRPKQPAKPVHAFPSVAEIEALNARRGRLDAETAALQHALKQQHSTDKGVRSMTSARTADALTSSRLEGELREILRRSAVIYGADSRSLVVVTSALDPALAQRAASVAALVADKDVDPLENGCRLNTSPFLDGSSSPLCETERFRMFPTAAFCTGFLASPTQIVTAGHCVRTQKELDHTWFIFGFTGDGKGDAKKRFSRDEAIHGGVLEERREDAGGDYAIIRIPEQKARRQPLSTSITAPAPGTKVYALGHPQGLPLMYAGSAEVRPWTDPAPFFRANLDAYGGNSGSPVFDAASGRVIGILVEGEPDFASKLDANGTACDATLLCPKSGCQGEKCTRVSVFASRIRL